jgi:hypothetical protein
VNPFDDETSKEYGARTARLRRRAGLLGVFSAALDGNRDQLRQHVDELDLSSRRTLFAACAAINNMLASADVDAARLRKLGRVLSAPARAALLAVAEGVEYAGGYSEPRMQLVAAGLLNTRGELTRDGRTVLDQIATDAILLAQVADRVLSEGDMDHE